MPKPPNSIPPQPPNPNNPSPQISPHYIGQLFTPTFTQQPIQTLFPSLTIPPEIQMKDQEWHFTQRMLFPLGQWLVSNRGIASKELEPATLHVDELLRAHARCERVRQDMDRAVYELCRDIPDPPRLMHAKNIWATFILRTRLALKLRVTWRSYELLRFSPLMIVRSWRQPGEFAAIFKEGPITTYHDQPVIAGHITPAMILRDYAVVRQQPIEPSPIGGVDYAPSFCRMEVLWDEYLAYFKAPFTLDGAKLFWASVEQYPRTEILDQPKY